MTPIEESSDFTPYESQRRPSVTAMVAHTGADRVPDAVRVASINGLELQAALLAPDGHVYQYYFEQPIPPGTSLEDFQAAGGIQLDSSQVDNYTVADLQQHAQDRAVPVAIGAGPGVVIWADPEDPSGRRMHHVYWEADEHLIGLIIDAPAEEAVESARRIACRGIRD